MTAKLTKDELFLCTVAKVTKSDTSHAVSRYEIGQMIQQNNKSVDNTVQILVKTNFMKRVGDVDVCITEQGLKLVEMLLEK
jgi:Mn-dependent DtxR family transcriptional regulator